MSHSVLQDCRDPFFWCDNRVLDAGLSVHAVGVYCVLARHADKNRRSFPGIRRIAGTLHIGPASVLRAIEELEAASLVHKTPRFDPSGDQSSHLYHLLAIKTGGCSATETPVPLEKQGVPLQKHGCSATETEQDPIEQEPINRGGEDAPDPLLEYFSEGFRLRYGHKPTFRKQKRNEWDTLCRGNAAELLRAKIAAWWDHPLPRTFRGARTFPAFLQWFDDIEVNGDAPPPGRVVSADEYRAALREGSPAGRTYYREIVGEITDDDAKIRTLIHGEYAADDAAARAIIAACDSTGH